MTRAMKDSGIEWIGQIPENWVIVKYGMLTISGMGETILKNDISDTYIEGLIPIYSATQSDTFFGYKLPGQVILSPNDLVIPARGNSIGYIKRVVRTATCTQTTIYSKIVSKFVISKFLYYQGIGLKTYWFNFDETAIPQITVNQVNANKVVLPPLEEQERIASILDEKVERIDAIIADTKQSIEELKQYKQSLITETVTKGLDKNVPMKDSGIEWIGQIPEDWEVVKVKRLGKADNGITYKPIDETNSNHGRLVLRSSNIQNGKLTFKDNVYIDKSVADNKLLYKNDILICSRNGSKRLIGKNILITENKKYSFGAFMMRFRPFLGINAKYIQYILHSNIFEFYLGSFLTSTINQLTVSNFYNITMVLPSNSVEQDKIVEFLDIQTKQIDQLIQNKEVLITQYEEYKKSMIYEYVTGKRSYD